MIKFLLALIVGMTSFTAWGRAPGVCESRVSLGAERIFFSPNSESIFYALAVTPNGLVSFNKVELNRMDQFHSGYRVFGDIALCGENRLFIEWTHLRATHRSRISVASPSFISDLFNVPAIVSPFTQADAKTRFHYVAIDGRFEFPFYSCPSSYIIGGLGVHYVELRSHNRFNFVGNLTLLQILRKHFRGIGPEIYLSAYRCLGCGFSLFGNFAGAMVIGRPKERLFNNLSSVLFTLEPKEEAWKVVPYMDIRLGFGYDFVLTAFCDGSACLRSRVELGYEALVYWQALRELSPSRTGNLLATGELYLVDRNVTMHGPFISFTFFF